MKIKTDFTPGPWEHITHKIGFSTADYVLACKSETNADSHMHVTIGEKKYGYSTKESAANARLIASAPETFNSFIELFIHSYIIGQIPGEIQKKCISIIEKVTQKKFFDILKEYGEEKND